MAVLLSAVFIGVMLWASVHDIRTRLIPSIVTCVGMIVALSAATFCPADIFLENRRSGSPVLFDTELPRPVDAAQPTLLAVGLSGMALWLNFELAFFPPFLYRRGFVRALRIWPRQLGRELYFLDVPRFLIVHGIGIMVVLIAWMLGGMYWRGFITAIIGFLAGAASIWSVRVVGSMSLRKEAMGFGDVIFLGTVGAWLGWQALLPVWCLALAFGLIFGLPSYFGNGISGNLPYGPSIALAAVVVRFAWQHFEVRWLRILDRYIEDWKVFALALPVYALLFVAALRSFRAVQKRWDH